MALSPHMNVMLRAAEKAARGLIRDFGEVEQLQVSRKGPGDFVSAADLRAESVIYEELKKARPDYGVLMEERGKGDSKGDEEYCWIVDPLDGTTNFLHGIPHWNISIALAHRGDIIAGLVFDPIKNESFRAERGSGAFMMNKRLRVSGRNNLADSVFATGIPTLRHAGEVDGFLPQLGRVMKGVSGVRRMGAAALDLAYVAAGRCDGYWEYGLSPWDIAAGMLIVREAGGYVTSIDSKDDPMTSGQVVAANPDLQPALKKLLTAE